MSVTGEPDGNPVKCGIPIGDLSAGLFCAVAILSALHARERTGRGQYVDTSLFEGALALSIWETAELWATGRVPGKLGSAHRLTAPYQALRTGDGYITVGGNTQPLFERLCAAVGRAGAGRRPALRHQRRPHGQRRRRWWRSSRPRWRRAAPTSGSRRWSRAASRAGRSTTTRRSSPTRTPRRARWRSTLEHPVEGTIRALGIPVKLSDTPGAIRRPAPLLGQHTEEILREAGFADGEIEALR